MPTKGSQKLITELNMAIEPIENEEIDFSSLLEKIGNARLVLIGDASHGTEEFYQKRMAITKQLITRKGFMAVAIEGDWPDVYSIYRFIQGKLKNTEVSAAEALSAFKRFPSWMWRNTAMLPFISWLRTYNDSLPQTQKIGFYGLDLYSLNSSIQAVIQYLEKVDPKEARLAKERYACFDHTQVDPQAYGYLTKAGIKKDCIRETVEQCMELQHHAFEYLKKDGISAEDEYFFALQNARLVKNAENYYRAMFEDHVSSWNLRDTHMADTVSVLANHLEARFNCPAKIVIWAHNSHVGDARATEWVDRQEINIGQLLRERFSNHTYLIGFSTYEGEVTAANNWDGPAKRMEVVPGLEGSYEALFHKLNYKNFLLDLAHHERLEDFLKISRLQRAIGVVYRPQTERISHYYLTRLPFQFDCLIHLDKTHALQPL